MHLYRYIGDPDDDNAPLPVVAGRLLHRGDATDDESVKDDRRFTRVLDPSAPVPSSQPARKRPAARGVKEA